ncbi:MAG: hypothetical protein LBL73_03590 [Synergistaceae bacterium]|nr:hypothetical protein [Synergistaceae bacterium]
MKRAALGIDCLKRRRTGVSLIVLVALFMAISPNLAFPVEQIVPKKVNIRSLTPLEVASLIARQIPRIDADNLNGNDLELIQKLILEFKDELYDLGVTVIINIDHPFSALVSGDIRITPRESRARNPVAELPSDSWVYDAIEQLLSYEVLEYDNTLERPLINFQYIYPFSSFSFEYDHHTPNPDTFRFDTATANDRKAMRSKQLREHFNQQMLLYLTGTRNGYLWQGLFRFYYPHIP